MDSDMNSRRVLASREMTGDSGILSEVKSAFLHYDFPDFSTGVVKSRVGAAANRRAIGHGNLAEKAILPALPHLNDFPYTIRLTCEVTSSNGSSSMASACGASLALLDAGVPLVSPVAGVSVGLAPGSNELLLDITGTEDHYGDMDFKICGTHGGITAMQLDVKRPLEINALLDALDLAKEGRRAILNAMENECKNTLPDLHPRTSMKSTAPRVEVIKFDPNRKRDLIGPGGAVLRQLEDRFDVSLDLSQEGRCLMFGSPSSVYEAKSVIMDLVCDVEEGGVYEGTVVEIKDFGAVIELLRNKEGLLHVSEITDSQDRHPGGNIGLVKEHLAVGDKIEVLCTKIDQVQGSVRLSRKKLLQMRGKSAFSHLRTNNANDIETTSAGSLSINSEPLQSLANSKMKATVENEEKVIEGTVMSGDGFQDGEGVEITDELHERLEQHMRVLMRDDYIADDDEMKYNTDTSDDGDNDDETFSGSAGGTDTTDVDALWMERYNELLAFNSKNGHCNVPRTSPEHPQLANWVKRQRLQHKLGRIPDDRRQLLDDIGFVWSFADKMQAIWNQRFDELVTFKKEHGHCNVSYKYTEYPQLAEWVRTQRTSHKKGRLPDDRIQRLDGIGFAWSPPTNDQEWEKRYNELLAYKNAYGYADFPVNSAGNPRLGSWVAFQRAQHENGELSHDRIQRLNDIGFSWTK